MKEIEEVLFDLNGLVFQVKPGRYVPELHELIHQKMAEVKTLFAGIKDMEKLAEAKESLENIVELFIRKNDEMKSIIRAAEYEYDNAVRELWMENRKQLREEGIPVEFLRSPKKLKEFIELVRNCEKAQDGKEVNP